MEVKLKVKSNLDRVFNEDMAERAMTKLGIEAEKHAKTTINTFHKSTGTKQGVHTGAFRDSVRSYATPKGFVLKDGVPYGIYHEFGTEKHFVPFVDGMGNLTSLGQWAVLNFELLGFGAQAERRATREEIVKSKGGMMVSLEEMSPFRKALVHVKDIARQVLSEELENANVRKS